MLTFGSGLTLGAVIAQENSAPSRGEENGLPPGAIARIFSTRLWHSVPIQVVGLSADEKMENFRLPIA